MGRKRKEVQKENYYLDLLFDVIIYKDDPTYEKVYKDGFVVDPYLLSLRKMFLKLFKVERYGCGKYRRLRFSYTAYGLETKKDKDETIKFFIALFCKAAIFLHYYRDYEINPKIIVGSAGFDNRSEVYRVYEEEFQVLLGQNKDYKLSIKECCLPKKKSQHKTK